MPRKSQSELVSTALLILIAVAAVIVIWLIVNFFLKLRNEDKLLCSRVQLSIVEAKDQGIGIPDTVMVMRQAGGEDGDVTGVKFIVDGMGVVATHVNGEICNPPETPDIEECDLSLGLIESKTVTIGSDFVAGDEVAVAAIVGESRYICNIADSTKATSA